MSPNSQPFKDVKSKIAKLTGKNDKKDEYREKLRIICTRLLLIYYYTSAYYGSLDKFVELWQNTEKYQMKVLEPGPDITVTNPKEQIALGYVEKFKHTASSKMIDLLNTDNVFLDISKWNNTRDRLPEGNDIEKALKSCFEFRAQFMHLKATFNRFKMIDLKISGRMNELKVKFVDLEKDYYEFDRKSRAEMRDITLRDLKFFSYFLIKASLKLSSIMRFLIGETKESTFFKELIKRDNEDDLKLDFEEDLKHHTDLLTRRNLITKEGGKCIEFHKHLVNGDSIRPTLFNEPPMLMKNKPFQTVMKAGLKQVKNVVIDDRICLESSELLSEEEAIEAMEYVINNFRIKAPKVSEVTGGVDSCMYFAPGKGAEKRYFINEAKQYLEYPIPEETNL